MEPALLPLLPSLVALIEEEGVSRAARRLGVSQPRMSARLSELRALLADPLLVPASTRRGLMATARGAKLARVARASLDGFASALSAETFDAEGTVRTFKIVIDDTAAVLAAPALVGAVRAAGGAGVSLAFFAFDRSRIEGLESGAYDLALGRPHQLARMPSLKSRVVLRSRFVVITSVRHDSGSMCLEEFCRRQHVLISSQPTVLSGRVDEELAKIGRTRAIAASVQSHLLATELVAATDLIATVPETPALRARSSIHVHDAPVEFEPFLVSAAWHHQFTSDPAHAWLRERIDAAR